MTEQYKAIAIHTNCSKLGELVTLEEVYLTFEITQDILPNSFPLTVIECVEDPLLWISTQVFKFDVVIKHKIGQELFFIFIMENNDEDIARLMLKTYVQKHYEAIYETAKNNNNEITEFLRNYSCM